MDGSGAEGRGPRFWVFGAGEPEEVAAGDLDAARGRPDAFVWCDVVHPRPEDLAVLERRFGLHPLSVEDALHAHQRPKIEPYGEGDGAYWFVVVHPATLAGEDLLVHEVAAFAGRRFLITVRGHPVYGFEEIERRWRARPAGARGDSGFFLYTVLDAVVDGYFPVAERFGERVDDVETLLFSSPSGRNDLSRRIFRMKKDSQRFRRAAWPLRDMLAPIVRGDLPVFSDSQKAYFRDVYDHAVRVVDQVDATRDLANSALDVLLAVTANRQNEVTKQLTIIATIFLPLTFITGFFGQNFALLTRHITTPRSFWIFGVASEVAAIGLLVLFFKWRRWF